MTSLDLTVPFAPEPSSDLSREPDAALAAAVELAREAAVAVGGDSVGEHLEVRADGPVEDGLVATHAFRATVRGYVGWHWAVTVARVDGEDAVTVDEVVLLPGDGALLAPAWVPWDERVRPGDLSPGDLLPTHEDDVRLVPAYTDSGDPAVEEVAFELGLGRESVLSRDGREMAADRWFTDRGPDAPMAKQAPGSCGTCGFSVRLAGSLSAAFGVCANEAVETDGQVVSVEYGCGAHSGVRPPAGPMSEVPDIAYDDGEEITANVPRTADAGPSATDILAERSGETPPESSDDTATGDAAPGGTTPDAPSADAVVEPVADETPAGTEQVDAADSSVPDDAVTTEQPATDQPDTGA